MNSNESSNWLSVRIGAKKGLHLGRAMRATARFVMCLALLSPTLLLSAVHPVAAQKRPTVFAQKRPAQDVTPGANVRSEPATPEVVAVVNFKSLAAAEKRKAGRSTGQQRLQLMPAPQTIQEEAAGDVKSVPPGVSPQTSEVMPGPEPPISGDKGGPLVPSPAPSLNYLAHDDQAKGGGPTGTFTIPPDTMGAIGLDKNLVMLNNNFVVQDKATGAQLSLVSMDTFWAPTTGTGPFDPRVQYDPYNNRWLVSAVSNAQTPGSSILVGVSSTSDPQGTYTLFRFQADDFTPGPGLNDEWADFPMLGFNKNWVAVSVNMFTISTNANTESRILVLDYPSLRLGTFSGMYFNGILDFCVHPATTFSATENTLYAPNHNSSAGANYRLNTITGTPAAPVYTQGVINTRTGGGWTQPTGDNLPQQCIPGVGLPTQVCPVMLRNIETGDAFIRSNVVFRNGKIYYPQTIALPAGGLVATTHYVAQWTALNTDGTFFDGGRVEDPTATRTNGGKNYAYPSLSVNKNNDILLGFSEFESDDYVDAGYTFRLGSDAQGTMRDPLIYKEGEDYYEKIFSGTRNRWGDYSHTVVDPSNDRDFWTIQEYAKLRVGILGTGANDSRWSTWWAKVSVPAGAGDLLISEFRLRGPDPNSPNNEFVEIYNNNDAPLTVLTFDGSAGYSLAASDGIARFTIPNGTVIPARGHYLGVNSVGYSLSGHPAGNDTTATGNATYTTDIPDNAGIALFNTAIPASFTLANRLDAVGSASEANVIYKEGAGYADLSPLAVDYSLVRDYCGKGGSSGVTGTPSDTHASGPMLSGPCPSAGLPKDTNVNIADFLFVDPAGFDLGMGKRLGAPGPENLSSPIQRNNTIAAVLLDSSTAATNQPNRVRDPISDPPNNSTFGTLDIRRRFINNTGATVTRLRFRIVDYTTFPVGLGIADLRVRTSGLVVVSGIMDAGTCAPAGTPCTVVVQGTTLETPPSQPGGGAFNSNMSAGAVTLANPIAPGGSVNLRFLLGIQQTGSFKFFFNVEALP